MTTAPRALDATDLVSSTTWFRTNHPFVDADLMAQVRAMAEPNKGKLRGAGARLLFDDVIGLTATPDRVDFREGNVGGVSGWWAEPEGAVSGRVALHLHGGWFNWGTASAGRRHIVGAVVLSPVTDLTLGGRSWIDRAQADPYFLKDQAQSLIDAYLAGHKPTDPAASPLFADPTGFPPTRLHVGDAEVLLDDAVRYAERAVAASVDARLDVWEGMAHCFLGSVGGFQAVDAALDLIGAFLRDRFGG